MIHYQSGDYIWSRTRSKYWPGIVLSATQIEKPWKHHSEWVYWFGDGRISEVKKTSMIKFHLYFEKYAKDWNFFSTLGKRQFAGMVQALKFYRRGLVGDSSKTLEEETTEQALFAWAFNGFPGRVHDIKNEIPNEILYNIQLKKDANNTDFNKSSKNYDLLEKFATEDLENLCISCYHDEVYTTHPLFQGGMCFVCMERYTGRFFMIGADNIHYCCAICGGFGKLVVCSMLKCGLSYCYECLDNLGSTGLRPYIANMAVWICFVCNSTGHSRSGRYIQCRADWRNHLHALFNTHKGFPIPRILLKKERLRVLSLFDGIATGLLALNQLDVNVESYFAAELDYNAKMIALKHHDEKIQYLGNGDVRKINARVLADILPIHLVLGGSPCNDLSRANPDRKGLFDPDGTGVLFYEFSRIITTLKQIGNQAFFWLFENVASMPEEVKSIISRILECQPSQINAYPCVSPQDRKRYFWGNCPSLHVDFSYDGKHVLQDYLDPGRTAAVDHIRTITTNSNSLLQGSIKQHAVYDENMELAPLTIKEIEKIFGLPQDYTQFDTLSKSARLTLVGRAWSVQTICMLLHFVKYFYRLNRDKVLHYD